MPRLQKWILVDEGDFLRHTFAKNRTEEDHDTTAIPTFVPWGGI